MVWEGGRGLGEVGRVWKVGLGAFRLPKWGVLSAKIQSMNFVNESWEVAGKALGSGGQEKCGLEHLF